MESKLYRLDGLSTVQTVQFIEPARIASRAGPGQAPGSACRRTRLVALESSASAPATTRSMMTAVGRTRSVWGAGQTWPRTMSKGRPRTVRPPWGLIAAEIGVTLLPRAVREIKPGVALRALPPEHNRVPTVLERLP